MNTVSDLIPLHDNRPGLRSLVQVEVREAAVAPATLDFVASTATLDRYREVIEPNGLAAGCVSQEPGFFRTRTTTGTSFLL